MEMFQNNLSRAWEATTTSSYKFLKLFWKMSLKDVPRNVFEIKKDTIFTTGCLRDMWPSWSN